MPQKQRCLTAKTTHLRVFKMNAMTHLFRIRNIVFVDTGLVSCSQVVKYKVTSIFFLKT